MFWLLQNRFGWKSITLGQNGSAPVIFDIEHRPLSTAVSVIFDAIFSLNPDWKLLMMISAIYMLISTILLYFCPESPRWLMTHAPEEISKRKIIKFISLVDSNSVSKKSAEDLYEQIPKQPMSSQNKRTGIVSPKILFSTKWVYYTKKVTTLHFH